MGVRRSEFEAWASSLDQRGLGFRPSAAAPDPVGSVVLWLDPTEVQQGVASEVVWHVRHSLWQQGG